MLTQGKSHVIYKQKIQIKGVANAANTTIDYQ